jgi:hypothetical protein
MTDTAWLDTLTEGDTVLLVRYGLETTTTLECVHLTRTQIVITPSWNPRRTLRFTRATGYALGDAGSRLDLVQATPARLAALALTQHLTALGQQLPTLITQARTTALSVETCEALMRHCLQLLAAVPRMAEEGR